MRNEEYLGVLRTCNLPVGAILCVPGMHDHRILFLVSA